MTKLLFRVNKDFKGHKGVPGQRGGSAPKGEGDDKESFVEGDKVYFTSDYAGDDLGERFTLVDVDNERGKARVEDKNGRGWGVHFGQITHTNPSKKSRR